MKRRQLILYHGGLMRCCVDSYVKWVEADPEAEAHAGQEIECIYERKATMVVDDKGYVQWIAIPKEAR